MPAIAAPTFIYQRSILPETTNTYNLGGTSNIWNRIYANFASTTVTSATTICLTGDLPCRTTWPSGGGGTGNVATSSAETATYIPFWNSTAGTPAELSGGDAGFAWNNTAKRLTSTFASTTAISGTNATFTSFVGALTGNVTGDVSGNAGTVTNGVYTTGAGSVFEVPLTFGDGLTRTANDVDCDTASGSVFGCLASADWTTFNGKFTLPALTLGSVLFSDGSTIAQDNANFFFDNTQNNLGLNQVVPWAKLEITATTTSGTTTATGYGVSSSQIRLGSVAEAITVNELLGGIDFVSNDTSLTGGRLVTASIQSTAAGTHTGTSVPSDLVFFTSPASSVPTEKLRITNTGIGVGTSTPYGRFAITSNGTGADTRGFTLANVNNVAVFSIGDSGETAIGTTTDANSNFSFAVAPTDNAMAVGDNVARFIHGDPGQTATNLIIGGVRAASSAYNQLTIQADYDGTPVEQFTFRGDGNLGIGSSSPLYDLSLSAGANNATKDIKAFFGRADSAVGTIIGTGDGTLNSGFIGTLQNFGFYFVVNNTEVARFNTSGQLGIGTSTPNSTLNLAATSNARLTLTDTDATANSKHFFLESNADKFSIGTTSDALVTSLTRALSILTDGNVGIGSTSPSAKLAITGTGATTGRAFAIGDSANTERLVILDNGNIGQGTTTPETGLVIRNGTAMTTNPHSLTFRIGATGTSAGIGIGGYTGGYGTIQGLGFTTNTGSYLLLNPLGGNVSVGTFGAGSPVSPLTVAGGTAIGSGYFTTAAPTNGLIVEGNTGIGTSTTPSRLTIEGTNTNAGGLRLCSTAGTDNCRWAAYASGNTSVAFQKLSANGVFSFQNSVGAEEMRLNNNGFIGIGTTSPYAKLSVVGGTSGTAIGVDMLTGYTGNIMELKVASTTVMSINQTGTVVFANSGTSTFAGGIQSGTKIGAPYFNATSTTATSTFAGGLNATAGYFSGIVQFVGQLIAPISAAFTPAQEGQIGIDTTSNQFKFFSGGSVKVLGNGNLYPAFTYATTTAWTGTTTIPLGVARVGETWNDVTCFTDVGTVGVSFYDGTNRMTYVPTASTTVNVNLLTTNNTFTALEKRYVDVGTPASSPTKISCTVSKSITAD